MITTKYRYLIFTATFNEAENITPLIQEIHQFAPQCDILVVDDNSPDGTGRILDDLARQYSFLKVHHRQGKLGLGTAHTFAMNYALDKKYDALITMDADFSHHPQYLPILIDKLHNHDFVIGSRYIDGGRCDYGPLRMFISRSANLLARLLLNIKLKECTTSYRGFRRELLQKLPLAQIASEGYSFFFEMVFYVTRYTQNLAEFPIIFEDRRFGRSKISKKEIINGVLSLFRLFFLRLVRRF